MDTHNPWEDYSLGTRRNILKHAAAHSSHFHTSDQNDCTDSTETCPSLELISLLRDVKTTQKEIDEISTEIHKRLQDKETRDLTNKTMLEEKISLVNSWSNHLQEIVKHKTALLSHLQQPYVGTFIRIESKYKQHLYELITMLVPTLSDLGSLLDNIDWSSKHGASQTQFEPLLSDIATILATLHGSLRNVTTLNTSVQQLHSARCPSTEESLTQVQLL